MRTMANPMTAHGRPAGPTRPPAVAGSFYPDDPGTLRSVVHELLDEAAGRSPGASIELPGLAGLLVPHAGLVYSGVVATSGWCHLRDEAAAPSAPPTSTRIVLLGTNHGASWLKGIGAWDAGAWNIPTGSIPVDEELASAIVALGPPYQVDRAAHRTEHSIEVQLPILRMVDPGASIVPLAVSCGTGVLASDAGARLGSLLASWPGPSRVILAISSDMAHYPGHEDCEGVTARLLDPILATDPEELTAREGLLCASGIPRLSCGMCGIAPAVVGLAALRAMGVRRGVPLAAATSADCGGPLRRTVGYLAVGWGSAQRP